MFPMVLEDIFCGFSRPWCPVTGFYLSLVAMIAGLDSIPNASNIYPGANMTQLHLSDSDISMALGQTCSNPHATVLICSDVQQDLWTQPKCYLNRSNSDEVLRAVFSFQQLPKRCHITSQLQAIPFERCFAWRESAECFLARMGQSRAPDGNQVFWPKVQNIFWANVGLWINMRYPPSDSAPTHLKDGNTQPGHVWHLLGSKWETWYALWKAKGRASLDKFSSCWSQCLNRSLGGIANSIPIIISYSFSMCFHVKRFKLLPLMGYWKLPCHKDIERTYTNLQKTLIMWGRWSLKFFKNHHQQPPPLSNSPASMSQTMLCRWGLCSAAPPSFHCGSPWIDIGDCSRPASKIKHSSDMFWQLKAIG